MSVVLGPKHCGIPVGGQRIWAASATPGGKLVFHGNPFSDEVLTNCVFRKVIGFPSMFLFATKPQVYKYLDVLNGGRLAALSSRKFRPEDYLTSHTSARLHFHRFKVAQTRERFPAMQATTMYLDISQNVDWSSHQGGDLPRQTTSSCIWVDGLERPMLPVELVSAQGPWGFKRKHYEPSHTSHITHIYVYIYIYI